MEENKPTVDSAQTAVPEKPATAPAVANEDAEARIKAIEIERDNYKAGLLKEKAKNKAGNLEESEEDRIARIVEEKLAQTKIDQLDSEERAIYQKTLKENKELKLAQLNKTTTPPASTATHSESTAVKSTLITPEQAAHFKSKGWTDKDIENYKKNLQRGAR